MIGAEERELKAIVDWLVAALDALVGRKPEPVLVPIPIQRRRPRY